jgi:SGNH domain (fused to AT3 domains)
VTPLTSRAATGSTWPRARATLSAAQLSADLRAAARSTRVPSGLTPPLATAAKALPLIVTNGCHLQHAGLRSKPCIYGDASSRTSVVLFGDSHAATWFPALQLLSRREHWRLVILTKAGCPPVEVNIALTTQGHTPYPQCNTWRRNAQAQIATLHPALVIVSWARYLEYPEAGALAGVPPTAGGAWQDGVAAIFGFLHRAARHVVFISDTPTLAQLAPDCVSAHLTTVGRCATSRAAATLRPQVKRREIALARAAHIDVIDPTSWFCSPTTCPAVVGNILLYRDNAHMVPTWSRFIAPVLGDALRPLVG